MYLIIKLTERFENPRFRCNRLRIGKPHSPKISNAHLKTSYNCTSLINHTSPYSHSHHNKTFLSNFQNSKNFHNCPGDRFFKLFSGVPTFKFLGFWFSIIVTFQNLVQFLSCSVSSSDLNSRLENV